VLGFCRASAQYESRRESPEQLVAKLRELATQRPRNRPEIDGWRS
jgi:hypothetical protein